MLWTIKQQLGSVKEKCQCITIGYIYMVKSGYRTSILNMGMLRVLKN